MPIDYADVGSPATSAEWVAMDECERKTLVSQALIDLNLANVAEVVSAPDNGQIVLKLKTILSASKRGLYLLDMEEKLKIRVEAGISIWCEPVGDKSKLRQLRGVQIIAQQGEGKQWRQITPSRRMMENLSWILISFLIILKGKSLGIW